MAREALRPDAHLAHETGRAGLVEDRYARNERAAEEDGEKGLAEHGAALEAVAPILADRCAALTALRRKFTSPRSLSGSKISGTRKPSQSARTRVTARCGSDRKSATNAASPPG